MVGVEENGATGTYIVLPSDPREVWLGPLSTVLSAQYWTRLWIAQEFLLASEPILLFQNFQIGARRLGIFVGSVLDDDRIEDLTTLPGWKYFFWRLIRYEAVSDTSKPSQHHPSDQSASLASLIPKFATSGCQDKRDRVYALLSLADDGDLGLVNYSIGEDVVFRNTMALMKRHKRPLDELLLIGEALVESLELWPATRPSSSSLEINFDGFEDITLPIWGCTTLETYNKRPEAQDARETIETTCMFVGIRDGPDVHVFEYSVEKPKERPIVKYSRAYEYLRGRPPASFVPVSDLEVMHFWLENMPSEALHYFTNADDSTRPLWNWTAREFDISGFATDESAEQTDRDILPALRVVDSMRSSACLPWEGYRTSRVAQPFLATFKWSLLDNTREYQHDNSIPLSVQHPRSTTFRLDVKKYMKIYGGKE
ncbi:HET domain-containing protein [Fusarium keratoplasticum]|uniref:HET domain-containing protein n=1 Tax=Fusarium keratoplasticum TaxID=1328300 RepID=A0ACC0QJE0_9HYPO|nr:HET domain-containing protein [Fusarium keratoplasticum]KAI8652844.1 HET domain-containing protein [Fusarium keratoplasticum]